MPTHGSHGSLDLNKLLAGAQLPALPQSAIRLLELSRDANNGPAEFGAVIEGDPGLASQVLQFVNSSYFSFSRKVSSVKHGITLVGTRTIKNFALWSAVFSVLPNPKCGPLNLKILWQDSLRRALFARAVAKLVGAKQPEDVFAAALLQDMAIPLLAKAAPAAYIQLLGARGQGRVRLSDLEHEQFGWTHAQAAGVMARQWKLPEEFAALVENHARADCLTAVARPSPEKLAVALSALLPTTADPVWTECAALEGYYEKKTGPNRPMLAQLLGQTDAEFAEFAPLMKLSGPSKPLRESLREVLAVA
jgi:HD-like signal output (HDOD) protein